MSSTLIVGTFYHDKLKFLLFPGTFSRHVTQCLGQFGSIFALLTGKCQAKFANDPK